MDKYYKDLVDNVDELAIALAEHKNFKSDDFDKIRAVLRKLGKSRLQYKRQYNERFLKAI